MATELTENQAVDHILEVIDNAEDEASGQDNTPAENAAQPASDDQQQDAENGQEPETPAIEPPSTWKAELKDRWQALPEDLQRDLAQWETERNQGMTSKLEESAKARKAAEAEYQAAAQERQKYVTLLDQGLQQITALDPILAQAAKTDWVRMWRDDPANAGLLRAQVEQRVNQLQALAQERERVVREGISAAEAKAVLALADKIPEWKDDAKRLPLVENLKKTAINDYGFKPEELTLVLDPRHVLVLRDAMLYRQMQAAKTNVQGKRVAAPARTVRPGSPDDAGAHPRMSQRAQALKNRALRSGKASDAEDAALAIVGA